MPEVIEEAKPELKLTWKQVGGHSVFETWPLPHLCLCVSWEQGGFKAKFGHSWMMISKKIASYNRWEDAAAALEKFLEAQLKKLPIKG